MVFLLGYPSVFLVEPETFESSVIGDHENSPQRRKVGKLDLSSLPNRVFCAAAPIIGGVDFAPRNHGTSRFVDWNGTPWENRIRGRHSPAPSIKHIETLVQYWIYSSLGDQIGVSDFRIQKKMTRASLVNRVVDPTTSRHSALVTSEFLEF